MSDSLGAHRLQYARVLCLPLYPGVCSNSCPLTWWCYLPSPFAFTLSSIKVFSNESALPIRWPKYWSFSFNISPSNEYSGLISFRMDWLDLLAVQGTLKNLLQHYRSKATILWRSAFFIVQLSHPYMTNEKPQPWLDGPQPVALNLFSNKYVVNAFLRQYPPSHLCPAVAGTPTPSNSGAATRNSCSGQIRVLLRQCIPFPRGFFRTVYTANVFSLCFPMKINHKLEYLLCQSTCPDLFFLLNWRIISLQYCVGFCHLSTWIRHRETYIPSVLNLCLTSHSTPPLQVDTGHWFEFPESYEKSPLAVT